MGGRLVIVDPAERDAPPAWNVFAPPSGRDGLEAREFAAEMVIGTFRKVYAQWWGPRMDEVFRATPSDAGGSGRLRLARGDWPGRKRPNCPPRLPVTATGGPPMRNPPRRRPDPAPPDRAGATPPDRDQAANTREPDARHRDQRDGRDRDEKNGLDNSRITVDAIETAPMTDTKYRLAVSALATLIGQWRHRREKSRNDAGDAA